MIMILIQALPGPRAAIALADSRGLLMIMSHIFGRGYLEKTTTITQTIMMSFISTFIT